MTSPSLHQRFEDRVGRVLVELDLDLGPQLVGQVVELPACRDGHEERLRLLVDAGAPALLMVDASPRERLDTGARVRLALDPAGIITFGEGSC